jgi:transcriptional regulator with XRE-family HTH domain
MYGEFVKELRVKKEISLREFCKQVEMDASNWSKTERGLLAPPRDEEKLKKIASALGIKIGSDIWKEMKDLANIDAGIIPADIRSDEEVLKALPMFFRTMRSDKPTAEELDKLIDMIILSRIHNIINNPIEPG